MFEGSNRECNYPFHMKVTGLHLDGTMRWKGCSIHAQSKSVFQWALYIGCDIAKTYLFQCSCISQVPDHNYRRVIILGRCHESCSLLMCERCGMGAQRTQLTLSGCHATSLIPFLPPPVMLTWPALPYAKATTSRLLRRSQTTVYPVLLDNARACWTCWFHDDMDVISSNFDDRAPGV